MQNPNCNLDFLATNKIAQFDGRVSLFAKNLDTGAAYGIGEDTRVTTASTIKTAIMVGAHAEVAAGRASWSDPLTMADSMKASGSGVLMELDGGLVVTLRGAVNLMMVVSDNTATNLVLDHISADAVNKQLDSMGISEIRSLRKVGGGGEATAFHAPENAGFGIGVATPRGMVRLLEMIHRGEAVGPAECAEMVALMKRRQHGSSIGRCLEDVKIAGKGGALDRLRSDMGIVYSPNGPIAISMTCDELPRTIWSDDNPAYLLMSALSELLIVGLGQPPKN